MHWLLPPQRYPVWEVFALSTDVIQTFLAIRLEVITEHKDPDVSSFAQVIIVELRSPVMVARSSVLSLHIFEKQRVFHVTL